MVEECNECNGVGHRMLLSVPTEVPAGERDDEQDQREELYMGVWMIM